MGEMADYYIELGLEQGWSPVGSFRRPPKKPTCNVCNSTKVHWRLVDGGFKLFDSERQHPGNRYVPHFCPTSADGFGDCE